MLLIETRFRHQGFNMATATQGNQLHTDRSQSCCICSSDVDTFGAGVVLGAYDIRYFRCSFCGFVQTENPYWLNEAYASPIASLDLGLLGRNFRLAEITRRILTRVLKTSARCLDYGGGYGVFVRLMRDRGVDFSHFDPLAQNLFAQYFTATTDDQFLLATAFEVLEHLVDPHEHFAKLDQLAPHWLVTTELISDPAPDLNDWWYYLADTGQHISFYTKKSLELLALRYGRRLVSCGNGLHFFTKSKQPERYIRWLMKNRTSRWFDILIRNKSLLPNDFKFVQDSLRAQRKAA